MAREVTYTETRPRNLDEDDVDPEKGNMAICQCGLSDERPFCDGSHQYIEDEADSVYKYEGDDVDAPRHAVEWPFETE